MALLTLYYSMGSLVAGIASLGAFRWFPPTDLDYGWRLVLFMCAMMYFILLLFRNWIVDFQESPLFSFSKARWEELTVTLNTMSKWNVLEDRVSAPEIEQWMQESSAVDGQSFWGEWVSNVSRIRGPLLRTVVLLFFIWGGNNLGYTM